MNVLDAAFAAPRPLHAPKRQRHLLPPPCPRRAAPTALRVRPAAAAVAAAVALVLSPGAAPDAPDAGAPAAGAPTVLASQISAHVSSSTSSLGALAVTASHASAPTISASRNAVVAVAAPSLQDLDLGLHDAAPPPEYGDGEQLIDDGEFALSVRLVTAVVLGALVGMEGGAAALSLGVRAVTVTSLSAALGTVCALVPSGAATATAVHAVPPMLVPAAAAGGALLLLGAFAMLSPARPRPRSRVVQTAIVVALAAALGAACAAGQPLAAATAYLGALAICRSVPITRRQRKKRAKVTLRVNDKKGTRVVQGNSVEEAVFNFRRINAVEDAAV